MTKEGDCNEHTVLFASLARTLGVPTKVILGIVYQDGKFFYHAWNEVFLGEWVALDSTYGQMPADSTHIKIIEGDISRSSEIMQIVGKLELDILSYY